jgi:hypothetical protein
MTRTYFTAGLAVILSCTAVHAQDFVRREQGTQIALGAAAGYYSGFGLEFSGTFTDFARGTRASGATSSMSAATRIST